MITVLAGGVGGSRLLTGLAQVVPPSQITVIANTGDDAEIYGVYVSPDIDIQTYALAGLVDETKGWGIAGDTFEILGALARFGYEPWFRLGDRDFATCLHRTELLRRGLPLSAATARIARAFGLAVRILPMSDDPVRTHIDTGEGVLEFQEYLVRRGARDPVAAVRFEGAEAARPAPGVIEAIERAEAVVIAPSNPIGSIGPILAVPAIREAVVTGQAPVVAVSPVVGGQVFQPPADSMLLGLGYEVSARGVAAVYADLVDTLVIDRKDADLRDDIRALGLDVVVTDTVMSDLEKRVALARAVLRAAGFRRS